MTSVCIEMPWPPTANTYYRMVLIGKHPRMLLSKRGRVYKETAADSLTQSTFDRPVAVAMQFEAPNRRAYDIDNRVKPVLDALQYSGVIANDVLVDELTVRRGDICRPKGRCVVFITETDKE